MNFNLLLSEDFNKYAANVTVSGIAIVFAMLVLLVLIIFIFGKIMSACQSKETKPQTEPKEAKQIASPVITTNAASTDDDEIIAVISAAVAAVYSGSGKTAVVKSIKPVGTAGRSAWATAGLHQNIRSF